jgi:hypothetical protein
MRGGGGHLRLFRRGVRDGGGRLVLKGQISGRFISYEDNVGREKQCTSFNRLVKASSAPGAAPTTFQ